MVKTKEASSVVKVDNSLMKKVEAIIKKEENKFKFVNKKQFVDIAINEYLRCLEKGGKSE